MKEKLYIFNPGGNITALVKNFSNSKNYRVEKSKLIIKNNKEIEQVGFLKKPNDKKIDYILEMAGSEFCGNALRCAGFMAHIETGKNITRIKSGNKIFKIITNKNYVELYIEKKDLIIKDVSVLIYDIEHFFSKKRGVKTSSKIKAEGFIEFEKYKKYFLIKPTIFVKRVGTRILETACASGSIALAMHLAKENKKTQKDYFIKQISNTIYKVTIDRKYIILGSKIKKYDQVS